MAGFESDASGIAVDVLVVGGGMVGGTLAAALGGAGMRVAVIDALDPAAQTAPEFDIRASAIALGPQRMLEAVGLWERLGGPAQPILDIRVVDGASPFFCHYSHDELGTAPFGHMVENRFLRMAVFRRLETLQNVTLLAPARVAELERTTEGVRARLADGRRVAAPLVVGADGRSSKTRETADIHCTRWAYGQTGIVCTIAHERPHRNVAHEHFLPAGPFAILPLAENRSAIVWSERDHLVPGLMALGEDDFRVELTRRAGDFLGALEVVSPRRAFPFALQFAEHTIARRLALVGDAAHCMHPIAGQGMNMGLRDVAALAQILVEGWRAGLDLGGAGLLERYQRWRRFDNMQMLALTDGLLRLFSNDMAPLRVVRDLGLAAVNRSGPVKRFFMRHAMGLVGDLPRLLEGKAL